MDSSFVFTSLDSYGVTAGVFWEILDISPFSPEAGISAAGNSEMTLSISAINN